MFCLGVSTVGFRSSFLLEDLVNDLKKEFVHLEFSHYDTNKYFLFWFCFIKYEMKFASTDAQLT
jgi:hypothetical protein